MTLPANPPVTTEPPTAPVTAPVNPPAVPPLPPGIPPAQQEEDWEKRFKGLQRVYDKAQNSLTDLQSEHATTLEGQEALKQAQRQAQAELEKAQASLDALIKEKDTLASQLTSESAKAKRAVLILSEFSDLAAFEAAGMLPAATTEEEMRTKFTKFREVYAGSVNKTVQDRLKGSSPGPTAPTTPTPTRSKEEVYAELNRLAGSRKPEDRAKREALMAEWDEINKQPQP